MAKFDKVIPPGQDGKILLVVEGAKVHGSFEKTATVSSNDPDHPVMTLTVAGNEKEYVNVVPDGRIYLQGRYDEPVEKVLTFSSNEKDLDFKILGVTSNIDDKVTYRYVPGSTKGEWTLTVNKNPKLPTMSTFGTVFVATNSKLSPKREVQVQVVTKGSITVQPSTLNYGRVRYGDKSEAGETATRSVTLLKTVGEFKVEGVTFSSDNYSANIVEVFPGQRYKIDVLFTAPRRVGPDQHDMADMIVRTNDPAEPQVIVKLIARSQ